jgi:hypothetical protein
MPKLETTLMIYDPVAKAERARKVAIEGPEFLLDCLERDTSCLDMQMLAEAADSSPSCKVTLEVKIERIKRRQSWR